MQQNAAFGVAKSAASYLFIIWFYRVAAPEAILAYIHYEIVLAVSALFTGGLQSQSYKELDPRGLHLLALLFSLAWAAAAALAVLNGGGAFWITAQLVLLDRLSDIQLQGTRQDGRFLRYNLLDLCAQLSTKGGFLLAAMGHAAWLPLLALKGAAGLGWLVLRRHRWQGPGFLTNPRRLFQGRAEWLHYLGFDALNYASGQLDLPLLTALAPPPVVAAYFYARKFIRLPLVLLNYVLDPAYVALRGMEDPARRRLVLQRLLGWSVAAMIAFAWLLVPVLAWTSGDPAIAGMAAALWVTAHFWVLQRYADLVTLLGWPQKWRTLLRLTGTLANAAPLLLPLVGASWPLSLALIPLLAWAAALVFVFRRATGVHLLPLAGAGAALLVVGRVGRDLAGGRWLPAGDWAWLVLGLALVAAASWPAARAFKELVDSEPGSECEIE